MIRRFGALLCLLLVTTFSAASANGVCTSMPSRGGDAGVVPVVDPHDGHGSVPAGHDHTDEDATTTGCGSAASCSTSVGAPVTARPTIRIPVGDRIADAAELAPLSQLPDLEPPPPKA